MDKQWWLRSIEVIYSSTIGYESELFDFIHEVLQGRVDNVEELGLYETLDYEVAVPIVWLKVSDNSNSELPPIKYTKRIQQHVTYTAL